MKICELIWLHAEKSPQAIAILQPGQATMTYADLMDRIERQTKQLIAKGVTSGDRIGIQLPNGIDAICWLLAVMDLAAAAPLDPQLKIRERNFALSDFRLNGMIDSNGFHPYTQDENHPPARDQDLAMILHTSGTTGRRKKVPLTHTNLLKSIQNVLGIFQLNPLDRCFNIMPLFHLHGIFYCVLAPLASGGSVVCPAQFTLMDFPAWFEEYQPTWYSASPTFHQAILDQTIRSNSRKQSSLRFIRSSASPLSPVVQRRLEETLEAPVLQGYGMTECIQISCNPLPPEERRIGSVGRVAGPEVAILHGTLLAAEAGQEGEIVIRGPEVVQGYETEENDSPFLNGWLRTGDSGFLDSDSYLHVTGRLKETINRGGKKISPFEVEEVISEHPAVKTIATFPIPHTRWGEDVGAAVVLKEGCEVTEKELRIFAGTKLSSYKIPGSIIFVQDLPKTQTGKLMRRNIAEMFNMSTLRKATDPNHSRSDRETQVAEIWCEVLKVPAVENSDNFFLLGGDSILATHMISRVRRLFQIDLPLSHIFEMPTLEEFCQGMLEATATKDMETVSAPCSTETFVQEAEVNTSPVGNLKFSLFFFSADESHDSGNKYRLLLNAARFADENGFYAIWTPERHFHTFGGLYPNPSVIGAALAMTTKNLKIRAGSVVLPLQDPLRVAEEWAVVDNLSGGRVGISAASGWHVNDFVLSPGNYNDRREIMFRQLDQIRNLWRGNTTRMPNGFGQEVEVKIYPRPVQSELPVWLSCHSDSTFIKAGELGCNIITTIYKTAPENLRRQIALYRETLVGAGFNPDTTTVTLMLHTFVGKEFQSIAGISKSAFDSYFSAFVGLQKSHQDGTGHQFEWTDAERELIFSRALPELLKKRGLIGAPQFCLERAKFFQSIGVNEIACLIDFGIDTDAVLQSLNDLKDLKDHFLT